MNLASRYTTSLMDIILGSIGAFFFLLVILSASRRGIVQEGIQLPANMMILRVDSPKELKVGRSIHYFVAQLKAKDSTEIEKIFYSDVEIENGTATKLVEVNDKSLLATPSILTANDPPPIIVGVWLQDVFVPTKSEHFPEEPIIINISCKKIYKVNPLGFSAELNRQNNYFAAYSLNDGTRKDVNTMRYLGEPITRNNVPCRSIGEECSLVPNVKKRNNIPYKKFVYIDTAYETEETDKRYFHAKVGFLKLNNKEVDFCFAGGFEFPKNDPNTDPRDAIIIFIEQNMIDMNAISYLAIGERAVCAVFTKNDDYWLMFQGTNGLDLSFYPFKQYMNGTIGTIPKNVATEMIRRVKDVEPNLSMCSDEQCLRMLAIIVAGSNNNEPPYPAVRQNPLIWNYEK